MTILFRNMRQEELPVILDWAASEGWNPGLDDANAFFETDPTGFFVADLDGNPVAAISVVNHDKHFSFLGLYICLRAYRGRGIGFALWKQAIAHAERRTIGLDGVAAQQANYAKSGFVLAGATTRYTGRMSGAPVPGIRPFARDDLAACMKLDRAATGVDRSGFLQGWLSPSPCRLTVIADGSASAEGFATIRLCRDGAKIGPIVAPGHERALDLARAALATLPAPQVSIDLPASSRRLADRLVRLGFDPGFSTARMYRGPAPVGDLSLQAVASMELG
ncbi:GNAT family N-acetyltransferase [Paracoccus sp. MBLB3053]|uniref:GNAT family N-acetyltransferase n=1 Tax=Paracoccus aurantius TaxID=3073814 RepID=A0ABU2HWL1_9RHOB|nr:GNAT family N-acetyltransferase [Paracoccus sp. MBLB3053]MDS9469436.1 GNAT family N-acetyltransferase [Paracoccus sp. MBLB3053]